MNEKKDELWLELDDSEITSNALAARVEERVKARREQLGSVSRSFPTFQAKAPVLDRATPLEMQDLMRQLQELPEPPTHATLAPSPATRLPLFGRLWQLIRSQTHELVLFYVNRHVANQAQQNHLLSSALRHLSAIVQTQQQQIERLQARLDGLESTSEQTDE